MMNLQRQENPYSQPAGCGTCGDFRHVYRSDYSAAPCPVCGCHCQRDVKGGAPSLECSGCVTSRRLKHESYRRWVSPPTISESQLTADEHQQLVAWRARFPGIHTDTALAWISGQRYVPKDDSDVNHELQAEQAGAS